MRDFLKRILKPKYEALNRIEIIGGNLIANYNYLKSQQPQAVIFPVLKSNAYGHGLKEVCRILNTTDAPLVAVDSYPEAQIVYRYFKGKVLLLGEMPLGAYKYCKLARTEFVVYNEATLKHLARYGKKAKVHLFINSGMNREGIKDLNSFIVKNKNYLIKVEVTGLCSHLASAEENSLLNKEQEDKFIVALDILHAAGFFPRWIHLGNSAAIFKLNNKLLTAYRAGLAFYGYGSSVDAKKEKQLKPALNIFSHLIAIQELETGEAVSYNETYRASQPTKIGVIPFGYFEGLDRRLSNQAQFSVQGYQGIFSAKIAGRICMNLTCLEISNNKAEIGAEVQIVSANSQDYNSIANLAVLSQTIPYEFLVKLQTNIRREIV